MAKTVGITEEELYAAVNWSDESSQYEDIQYHKSDDGIAKITIARPQVHNAFRPQTVKEMINALADARYDEKVGVIILTGLGEKAFCSGGDQSIRGDYGGYQDDSGTHHLNVLDFQRQIRTCPKPVIAAVSGWAVGGGHVLHMMDNAFRPQTVKEMINALADARYDEKVGVIILTGLGEARHRAQRGAGRALRDRRQDRNRTGLWPGCW